MEIILQNPVYLWFLLSIPILIITHFLTIKSVRGKLLQFANFSAIERVAGRVPEQNNLIVLITRMIILICIVLAVVGTSIRYVGETSESDFVLAIDSSSSMLAKAGFTNIENVTGGINAWKDADFPVVK